MTKSSDIDASEGSVARWFDTVLASDIAIRESDTVFDGMFAEPIDRPARRSLEPILSVQTAFGLMGPHSPREIFTTENPPVEVDIENDPIPTDQFLGLYLPHDRVIKIFVRKIEAVANVLGVCSSDLERKVRLHELCHAVVHLGVEEWHREDCMLEPQHLMDEPGDWQPFLESRTELFCDRIDHDTHEFFAQAMTWLLVRDDERMREVFLKLMERQPSEYKLNENERTGVTLEVVRLLLGLVRRSDTMRLQPQLAESLRRLVQAQDVSRYLTEGK